MSTAANARLQQWGYGGGANQQFKIVDRGNGEFSIQARHTDMALDVFWGRADDGTPIVQYPWTGTSNQRWTFTRLGGAPPPPPSGGGGGALPTRLRVTNNCADPIWVAHSSNVPDAQNVKLARGSRATTTSPTPASRRCGSGPRSAVTKAASTARSATAPLRARRGLPAAGRLKFEASFAAKGSGGDLVQPQPGRRLHAAVQGRPARDRLGDGELRRLRLLQPHPRRLPR